MHLTNCPPPLVERTQQEHSALRRKKDREVEHAVRLEDLEAAAAAVVVANGNHTVPATTAAAAAGAASIGRAAVRGSSIDGSMLAEPATTQAQVHQPAPQPELRRCKHDSSGCRPCGTHMHCSSSSSARVLSSEHGVEPDVRLCSCVNWGMGINNKRLAFVPFVSLTVSSSPSFLPACPPLLRVPNWLGVPAYLPGFGFSWPYSPALRLKNATQRNWEKATHTQLIFEKYQLQMHADVRKRYRMPPPAPWRIGATGSCQNS
jgi:hypothetical protein